MTAAKEIGTLADELAEVLLRGDPFKRAASFGQKVVDGLGHANILCRA